VTIRGVATAILRATAPWPATAAGAHPSAAGPSASGRPTPPLGCRKLASLKLRDCGAPDGGRGFEELASILAGSLRSLDLSCTRVGSRGLLQLAPLTGLTELLLDMCPVTDSGCQVGAVWRRRRSGVQAALLAYHGSQNMACCGGAGSESPCFPWRAPRRHKTGRAGPLKQARLLSGAGLPHAGDHPQGTPTHACTRS
jgi:hypothetical protein